MKKYIVLFIIVIIAVCSIGYLYLNYKTNANNVQAPNKEYSSLYSQIINGATLATNINKIIDKNTKNNVSKNEKGYFEDNDTNSIIVEIKFKDSDNIFRIEQIYNNGIQKFINLYSNLNFKCTKIEYHKKTNLISYMYFEEV